MLPANILASLLSLPRVGRITVRKICFAVRNPPAGIKELHKEISRLKLLPSVSLNVFLKAVDSTNSEFDKLANSNISVYTASDDSFPALLKDIPNPPIILYCKGNINSLLDSPTITIIGMRKPSDWGYNTAVNLSETLSNENFTVLSGLAVGSDSAAHIGCLKGKGKTAAVLGLGLGMVYPKSNLELADEIIDKGGCLISEYAYNTKPHKGYYIERDQLQSGLSFGTIVVETNLKGGAMQTVNAALKQKRRLYCLSQPASVLTTKSVGNQFLIKRKLAIPIGNAVSIRSMMIDIKSDFNASDRMK